MYKANFNSKDMIIKEEVKAIFFDVGGTLLYPSPIIVGDVIQDLFSKSFSLQILMESVFNISVAIDKYYDEISKGMSWWSVMAIGIIERLEIIDFDVKTKYLNEKERLVENLEQNLKTKHLQKNLWHYYINGTHEVLNYLKNKGYYLAVISNSDGQVRRLLNEANLDKYFKFIIDSHFVGVEKPDNKIFDIATKASKFKPKEILYIGDIYNIDIVGARNSGMKTILIDHLYQRKNLETSKINSLNQLFEIF